MAHISKEAVREIIEDFALEIVAAKAPGPKPEVAVIDFRHDKKDGKERKVYSVPIGLLRFRKENGRIASDVFSYEKLHGVISETDSEGQKVLADFLKAKDPDQTDTLKKSVQQTGQTDPAIITADGFLINGNRRRLVLEMLWEETHDPEFSRMRVVILPGESEEGGPPTVKEIEQVENRYQLYKDGKSEYSNFDRALSIRRKIDLGMSLEEQFRDDPSTSGMTEKEVKKERQRYEEEFLGPLECVDRYLQMLGREEMYTLVSAGKGDRENRWQAFIDYYKLYKRLRDPAERVKLNIEEKEVGRVEQMAFVLIRLRDFSGLIKLHMLIRKLPKWVANPLVKKELLQINVLEEEPEDKKALDFEELDKKWVNINRTNITRQVNKARELIERNEKMETPVVLLRDALTKLEDDGMDTASMKFTDLPEALRLAEAIKTRADELNKEFYQYQKKGESFITGNRVKGRDANKI
ncbi:MAG: hypothetical protein UY78_C0007G0017 [Parcubacteria group bacterium GW2011_GWA1_53_13]|nr:MAG: hypothetical protein UT56_C0019G0008 [Candidatus Levybacteria bacterium GW2011_GWB1_39_7]KKW07373.1 MAG: hypothetical protein UY42_C0013G0007 [Parcubacteria group bacterium GW2011_GWA2_49_16]KKW33601.1 MAG: hypothetical protein UY78_C0007G0017 [Parcubacteria group bacterium GW2011_GWA1_53_13]